MELFEAVMQELDITWDDISTENALTATSREERRAWSKSQARRSILTRKGSRVGSYSTIVGMQTHVH